ncbi:MAG: serine hydrolase domain-containing protein [Bryobacterales bacterium]
MPRRPQQTLLKTLARWLCACLPALAAMAAGHEARIQRIENGIVAREGVVQQGAAPAEAGPKTIAARMRHYHVPGVSVAVIDGGEIAWAKGYGLTAAGASSPVTTDTLFQAASISKPVTAMAALHMARYGNFGLDQDVNAKLQSWKVPENAFTKIKPVTLRGILTHSAGLTVHGFRGYAPGEDVPTLLEVLDGAGPANSAAIRVDSEPGSAVRYSGGGYTVLQQLMIDTFGKPFPELMSIIILRQAGMANSTFEQPLPEARAAQAATGHGRDGRPVAGNWHTYPEMAAAGLWTTPSDLARFAIALQKAWKGESDRILTQKLAAEMLSKQFKGSGLGVGLSGEGKTAFFAHGGGNEGFRCFLAAGVANGQGAVIMTNSDNGDALARELLRAIAAEYDWPQYRD